MGNSTNKTTLVACAVVITCVFAGLASIPSASQAAVAQDGEAKGVPSQADETELTEAQRLEAEQKRLADRYKLLEEKLFSLHEYEKGSNPIRSKLMERAFIQSQEKMTTGQMNLIVKLLTRTKLKDAEHEQKEVLLQLNSLLELLQSEDRGKRVRDEIQRHQEYLKEVERILRIQKGIRGQAEGGLDLQRLANSETKTAERTGRLAGDIRENEVGGEDPDPETAGSEPEAAPEGEDGKKDESTGDGNKGPASPDPENKNEGGGRDEDPKFESKNGEQNESSKSDGESGDRQNSPQNPQPGGQGESGGESNGESGGESNGESQSGSESQSQNENPTRKRIQAAEMKMRDAQQKLETARREHAIEAMKEAEREMALAKRELEEILRQLREEEIERTLAMLEARFRQMLERQVRVYESTRKLDRIVPEQRATDFEIRAGKLSVEQNSIATQAARALLLLREDGSSVAFPATVDEMHQDMLQVASRLSAAKIGRITIQIEEDIIDTLDYLIEALVKTQEDLERMKQQSQNQGGGQPGDKRLVDQLAEIKMLRGLQERIFRRHRRYSRLLDDPDDLAGDTDDPEMQAALQRLAEKQARLTDIARDIVNEKNK